MRCRKVVKTTTHSVPVHTPASSNHEWEGSILGCLRCTKRLLVTMTNTHFHVLREEYVGGGAGRDFVC